MALVGCCKLSSCFYLSMCMLGVSRSRVLCPVSCLTLLVAIYNSLSGRECHIAVDSFFVLNGYEVGSYVEIRDCWDLQWYISIRNDRRLSVVCACGFCVSFCLGVKGFARFAHLPSGLLRVVWLRA